MIWEIEGESTLPEKKDEILPMTLDAAKKAIEKAKADLEPYREKIKEMKTEAQLLKVEDDESWGLSVDLGIRAKKLAKEIETTKDRIISPANEFTKSVRNLATGFTDILDSIESITKTKNRSYKVLQEQRALEAQKKIDEETKKLREKVNEEAKAAGVPAVEVPTPVLAKTQKTIRTAAGMAYSSEYWKFEAGPVHRNAPTYPGVGKPRITVYIHPDKQVMYEKGVEAGMKGDPLEKFKFALNEVKFELEVNEEGSATIVSVDGKLLPIIPAEFLEADSKAIRKVVDGGQRNIEGVKIWREDKEVYK
jgi:hypothetical protein